MLRKINLNMTLCIKHRIYVQFGIGVRCKFNNYTVVETLFRPLLTTK